MDATWNENERSNNAVTIVEEICVASEGWVLLAGRRWKKKKRLWVVDDGGGKNEHELNYGFEQETSSDVL